MIYKLKLERIMYNSCARIIETSLCRYSNFQTVDSNFNFELRRNWRNGKIPHSRKTDSFL